MTTNADQSSINAALRSRTHVHFLFEPLSAPKRAQVWKNFVERAPDAASALDDEGMTKLSQWHINGRYNKNIFNMARVWGEEQKIAMTTEAIEESIPAVQPLAMKEGHGTTLIWA